MFSAVENNIQKKSQHQKRQDAELKQRHCYGRINMPWRLVAGCLLLLHHQCPLSLLAASTRRWSPSSCRVYQTRSPYALAWLCLVKILLLWVAIQPLQLQAEGLSGVLFQALGNMCCFRLWEMTPAAAPLLPCTQQNQSVYLSVSEIHFSLQLHHQQHIYVSYWHCSLRYSPARPSSAPVPWNLWPPG